MSSVRGISKALRSKFGKDIVETKHGSFMAFTLSKDLLKDVVVFLFEHHFKMLIDIFAVDYPGRKARFELNYSFLNLKDNTRIHLKTSVAENESLPTITDVFSCAGWLEREAWDMYGVTFHGNKDLRRILTDYGFEGHPMRKDFPLTGYKEVAYDQEKQEVVYKPVDLTQAYRDFDFVSPWEGPQYNASKKDDK